MERTEVVEFKVVAVVPIEPRDKTLGTLNAAHSAALEAILHETGGAFDVLNAVAVRLNIAADQMRAGVTDKRLLARADRIDTLALRIGRCAARAVALRS